ncbi:hypothetical protein L6270_02135 [Candidatus Parcubacteria bacterium]|nr:hypothetical protein [Patescibacteria group bacterium]MBU4309455.1 hypothetical protein [Patescibacteria group bacterium]MBU4432417.1 hypothetical protein [Patescibacteria group bacterium]MBU4577816.1 hypothetical protein [Patescibacteria group bacterium]MCG2696809.1 hypothetical protein [Candidatus Parcubacteria bacterium]
MLKKILIISIFLLLPFATKASTLYFEPKDAEVGNDSNFTMDIKIDVEDCVNVVEGYIGFDKDHYKLLDFMTGVSIINLWVEQPQETDYEKINNNGQFHFSGGIPGGYCGKIPGDPGQSNIVARLVFASKSISQGIDEVVVSDVVMLDGTRVLMNDGLGTEDANLQKNDAKVTISKSIMPNDKAWQNEINADKTPPEPFVIELHHSPTMFDGKYSLVFYTTDKQSGVDYYEVLEIRPNEVIGEKQKRNPLDYFGVGEKVVGWKKAQTPYLLEDQDMRSTIKVRAVDKAGNEQTVEYTPPESIMKKPFYLRWKVFGLVIGVLVFLLGFLYFKIRRNNKYEEENYQHNLR